jgi:1-acyl-sn-glycerol-3-phosphate acyltransferase
MGYIRLFITAIALILFFIIGLPASLVFYLIGLSDQDRKDRLCASFVQFGFRMVTACTGCRIEVSGTENLPKDRGALYVPNHRSIFDIVFLVPYMCVPYSIISKKEVDKIPFLRFWMRQLHCFFLDRNDLKSGLAMVTDATERLKNGTNILIFPEGTRSREEGKLLDFHAGSFKPAIRAGAPVIPVTIIGTGNVFEPHMPAISAEKIRIIFGEPVETGTLPPSERKQIPERVREEIRKTYQENA